MKPWMIVLIVAAVVAALAAICVVTVSQWSITPHGRLTWRAAILLKFTKAAKVEIFREGDPPEVSRRTSKEKSRLFRSRPPAMAQVLEREVPVPSHVIPLRVYVPGSEPVYPVTVYYHGGGWFLSDLDTHDVVCRKLALASSSIVVSVYYRLAPENPFPAAVDDAFSAVFWVSRNAASFGGDPSRIAVAGDSAGGNLAAVVTLLARERKEPRIACQVLFYPATDMSRFDTQSHRDFSDGYFLTRKYIEIFRDLYARDPNDWTNPYFSPLLEPDLATLPPAVVVTAEFDPLRDEGEAYAARLAAAGVPVVAKRYDGIIHGFLTLDRLFPEADAAIALAGTELKRRFGAGNP
jgi:acetyl esterase/lipase